MNAYINKIIPFSSVDGPGNRTAIFFQGCNFNCNYCHNPETINKCIGCGECVDVCKSDAIEIADGSIVWDKSKCEDCEKCIKTCRYSASPKTEMYTPKSLANQVSKYKNFIQGITVSGGECTLQEEFLIEFFKHVKAMGLSCFIDSNGSNDFKKMQNLLDLTDKVMLDVKECNEDIHKKYIGNSNEIVLKNLKFLIEKNKLFEVRTVILNDFFDSKYTVDYVSKIIKETNVRYKIIKYRPIGVREDMKNINSPSDEDMNYLKNIALKNGCMDIIIV